CVRTASMRPNPRSGDAAVSLNGCVAKVVYRTNADHCAAIFNRRRWRTQISEVREEFMSHFQKLLVLLAFSLFPVASFCQQPLTWQQVRDKFEAVNPTLKAAQINIDESRANEVTAYLRPNPNLSVLADGTQLVPHEGVWQPLAGTDYSPNVSYLHERRHKRELRLEAAKKATDIAGSQFKDQRSEERRVGK